MRRSYRGRAGALVAAALVAAALAAVGCGAPVLVPKQVGNTHPQRAPAPTISDPPADPITAALVPKAIMAEGSITVAMSAANPPDEFTGPDGHSIAGLDAELAVALGDEMGLKWRPVNAPLAAIMPGLKSGRYGIGMSSFRNPMRRPNGIAFITYFAAGESFYIKANTASGITSLAGLCGKSVAVSAGSAEQADAVRQSKSCVLAGQPAVHVQVYVSSSTAGRAVESGRAAAGLADSQVAIYLVRDTGGALKLSGPVSHVVPYVIAVTEAGGLARAIQAAIKALTVDGVYTQILAKWGMASGALTDPAVEGQKAKY